MTKTSILQSVSILLLSTTGLMLSGCQQNTPIILCENLITEDYNDRGQANCALKINDGSGIMLGVHYGEPADGDEYADVNVDIQVLTANGKVKQTITETSGYVFGMPKIKDLDVDGRNEVLVPLMTGNANTVYAVWRSHSNSQKYMRAGEISAFNFEPAENGLFQTSARASAVSWATSYYKFIDGNITEIATAMTQLPDSEDGVETCTLSDDGGLALIGLTLAQAQDKFCG